MMSDFPTFPTFPSFSTIEQQLIKNPKTWLITGVAGFIGSNLLEELLALNQKVIGIDNFYSGSEDNLANVKIRAKKRADKNSNNNWQNFTFYNIDINDYNSCEEVFKNNKIDYVLHHAAIASVLYSIENPRHVSEVNISGFNNILELSHRYDIKSFVYASSSAVYGDDDSQIKQEDKIGKMLSPYALSKYANELFAEQSVKHHSSNMNIVGLRYFNVYGRRQDPNGAYAAVIPKWIDNIINNKAIYINGDGTTTRDFCSVIDVVKANILSCFNPVANSSIKYDKIYNIGIGTAINLNELLTSLINIAKEFQINYKLTPEYRKFIAGEVKHTCADISKAQQFLSYKPSVNLQDGLFQTFKWYFQNKS